MNLKNKRFILTLFVLCLGISLPMSNIAAATSYHSSVYGIYINDPEYCVIDVNILITKIWPATGHIEGWFECLIRVVESSNQFTRIDAFIIFGDGHDCDSFKDTETYFPVGNGNHPYEVEWGDDPMIVFQYFDIYVDSTNDDGYSTTVCIKAVSGAWGAASATRYIYNSVYWLKCGSSYFGFQSGFSVSITEPTYLYLS